MRVTVSALCLAVLLWPGARACPAEPRVDRSRQTDISAERRQAPVSIERGSTGETIERQGDAGEVVKDRGTAKTEYSEQTPRLERSGRTISPPGSPADPEKRSPAVVENPDRVYQTLLAQGWALYRDGNYAASLVAFAGAGTSAETETRLESELGMAYSLLKQGAKQRAIELLTSLVGQGYRLQATSDALAPLLAETGRLAEARNLLEHLPESRRAGIRELIEARSLRQRLDAAVSAGDPALLQELVRDTRSRLQSCQDTEYYYRAAVAMSRLGAGSDARELLEELGNCRPEDREWQLRLAARRLSELDTPELLEAVRHYYDSDRYGPGLTQLGQGLIWQRLDQISEDDPLRRSLLMTLLLLDPEDRRTMSMLAWSCYRRADYRCSERYFRQLLKTDPQDRDALEGLALTLAEAGAPLEAISAIESFVGEPGPQIRNLLVELYAQRGRQAYEGGDYPAAVRNLAAAVEHDPKRRDLQSLLHWSSYHLGRTDGLVKYLAEEYHDNPAPESARAYLDILGETGQVEKRALFVADLAKSGDPELRRLAAEDYYARGWLLRAASTDDSAGTCYSGCDRPELDNTLSIRTRNGDSGTSRLEVVAASAELKLQASPDRRWSFRLTPLWISSGETADEAQIGSYYRSRDEPGLKAEAVPTGYDLVTPALELIQEGERSWQLQVGTTPFGGPISPLPTFSASIRDRRSSLTLMQEGVRESVLSWIGLEDPYSQSQWGRVVRTGVNLSHGLDLEGPWWLSMAGEYHYYRGQNVADNQRLAASLSWGRTDSWHQLSRAAGLFATLSGFEHNLNFFTFGHGGYYSPELMFIAGPFIRLTANSCGRFWWDGRLSLGYSYRRTEKAPRYRKTGSGATSVPAGAARDIAPFYQGASQSQLTVDGRFRGLYQLGGSWFLGAEAGFNNSSDFTEVQAAVFLRYRFGQGGALCLSAVQTDSSLVPIP